MTWNGIAVICVHSLLINRIKCNKYQVLNQEVGRFKYKESSYLIVKGHKGKDSFYNIHNIREAARERERVSQRKVEMKNVQVPLESYCSCVRCMSMSMCVCLCKRKSYVCLMWDRPSATWFFILVPNRILSRLLVWFQLPFSAYVGAHILP